MHTSNDNDFNGILLIDKPAGITSHDVVYHVRKTMKIKKVGHAGTLDPNATGLMIILVGKGTKASQFLISMDKSYEGTIQLGLETDSYDIDGEVIAQSDPEPISESKIKEAMQSFLGDQYQKPPMYSAKKINGVPLYKHARKGQVVEREERLVRVARFELLDLQFPNIHFLIEVSKGTYVRSVAHDLGKLLGCGGCLTSLRRTTIGDFSIENAVELSVFRELSFTQIRSRIIPLFRAVPSHVLT